MTSTRTARRLIKASQPDSWRTLSDVALAELVERGLFDAELWTLTPAGQAQLDELGVEVEPLHCDVVGCVAAAAGRWDIVARPTSYRAVPLCRAHVAEHRADPQVTAVRPTAVSA
jgi:hypothetical protein